RFSYPIKKLPPFFQRHIAPSRFGIGFGFPAACRIMPFEGIRLLSPYRLRKRIKRTIKKR
ncbi:TPA: hypothetical protein ACFOA3_000144, partial [Neisseria meningitidis]|uniref:hypothetical protein n=1 Tax=Neisseria meningitidis TaxID=487 RepID=UPI0035F91DC8